jgi:hypothetical protein
MSALHDAFRDGNNRVMETYMLYMAQIKINNSEAFKDILPELTDI